MKRLLDDPRDDVERLLIEAAVHHDPPRGGKMRLMAALGVGSAVGLLSSEVFAWLSTGAGKATLAIAALGTAAGGAYAISVADPPAAAPRQPVPVSSAPPPAPRPEAPAREAENEAPDSSRPLELKAPNVTGARHERRAARIKREVDEPVSTAAAVERDSRRLGEETLWVDRLKVAAEQGNRKAVQRLLRGYAERFPEGQLRPEVDRIENELR